MKKQEYLTKLGLDIYNVLLQGGYAKGYGDNTIRICDKYHNPVFNAPKTDFQYLINEGVVELREYKWFLIHNLPESKLLPLWKSKKQKSK